ncbi:MAG: glycoside hydrolase family 97 N-terminal domain-containing protein, partial [Phycisphaerae bacterium]|nr:glycoside hydrolase family 97 N-terminal domain-containing protein [Phycisphaerae bacterium]
MRWNACFPVLAVALILPCLSIQAETLLSLASPDETVTVILRTTVQGRLTCSITQAGNMVIEPSPLGVTLEGVDLGLGVSLGQPARREIKDTYVSRGVKSRAINHCMAYDVPVTHQVSGKVWTLEVRVFNDGAAYRYQVPGQGVRRVNGESTAWCLPAHTKVWIQNDTANYEGNYHETQVEMIPRRNDKGDMFIGCPVTAELAAGGYALITEACLYKYSGMTLRPTGTAQLEAVFQDDPNGWENEGPVVSPWRVTILARDLNALVNSDV